MVLLPLLLLLLLRFVIAPIYSCTISDMPGCPALKMQSGITFPGRARA
jgi:hypothetical protein